MGWFRVDDELLTNPKVLGVSPAAKVLYISGLAYCSANLTDGRIPGVALALVAATAGVPVKNAKVLVTAGLWHKTGEGYEVHDYLDYQEPSEKARARREANRERVRSWRDKRSTKPERNGVTAAVTDDATNGASDAVANAVGTRTTAPNRPLTPSIPLTPSDELRADGSDDDGNDQTEPNPYPPGWPTTADGLPVAAGPDHPELWYPDRSPADRLALTNVAQRLGWTTPLRRSQLAAEWDHGLTLLDRHKLEDVLVGCVDARAPGYLRTAITGAARGIGVVAADAPPAVADAVVSELAGWIGETLSLGSEHAEMVADWVAPLDADWARAAITDLAGLAEPPRSPTRVCQLLADRLERERSP